MRRPPASAFAPLALLALGVLAGLALPVRPAAAQTLKLASLRVFRSDVVGPWVTYRVRTQSGRTPVREFTQRVAIVSKEKTPTGEGVWIELKTIDRAGTRIERGLFAPSAGGGDDEPNIGEGEGADSETMDDSAKPLKLMRYQLLTPAKKLYEYPVSSAFAARASGGVSSYELFEFDPSVRPVRRFLGADTVRVGRLVIPAVLDWSSRAGTDDWPMLEDSTSTYRLMLTQTYWRNAAVSITGFARSLFRVTTRKVPVAAAGTKPVVMMADTTMTFASADTTVGPTSMDPGDGRLLSWTELVLQGIGADAVAEVTQTPEPAPASEPRGPSFETVR